MKKITNRWWWIKYFYSIALIVASINISFKYAIMGIIELLILAFVSNIFLRYSKVLGIVFNDITFLLLNVQYSVLLKGGAFIQMIMLTNLGSWRALAGNPIEYFMTGILAICFSFIPIKYIEIKNDEFLVVGVVLAETILLIGTGAAHYSPMANIINLISEKYTMVQREKALDRLADTVITDFYKPEVSDAIKKPMELADKPNIILIFTEGLSQNVIDDSREIMPNVADFQSQSLTFDNYYNHTAATYRGIIGQLTSGYQRNNLDRSALPSIQSILNNNGYQTEFINVEPQHKEFSWYLEDLGFDHTVTSKEHLIGPAKTITDKDAYNILWEEACDMSNDNRPFFLAIYTLGTHVSFTSPDVHYGNGRNRYLNKFYGADYWFGEFFNKFQKNKLSDNTIIVYTSDHCTYKDEEYVANFVGDVDSIALFTNTIPLSIYYKGITKEKVNANGRNSLDLAPTLLDYLDISESNCFLGESLFLDRKTKFDVITSYDDKIFNTSKNRVELLSKNEEKSFQNELTKYYALKKKEAKKAGYKDREGTG